MLGLGLTLTIISYVLMIVAMAIYFVIVFKKKYSIAEMCEKLLFLFSFFVLMIESWALVLMNGGFNFNFNIGVKIDYLFSLLIIIPAICLLSFSSIMIKKNNNVEFGAIGKLGNYLLLPFTIVGIGMATVVFIFNLNYFIYYTM